MIDLSFTKDPQWIEARQKKWDLMKEDYCYGLSKKQREQVYQYFMFGTPPKKISDFYFTEYFTLFPLQTIEAHRFIAANYFAPNEWTEREWKSFSDSVLLTESASISRQEKLVLFTHYLGDSYKPNGTFPFLINQESEYRPFNQDPFRLFRSLICRLNDWIHSRNYNDSGILSPYLLNYVFSLIRYQPPVTLSHHVPPKLSYEEDYELKHNVETQIIACEQIRELMRLVYTRFHCPAYFSAQDEKFDIVSDLFNRFESMQSVSVPQELVNNWQWVKRRSKMYELTFKIPEGMEDDVRQIEYDLYANSEYIINDLEKINGIDIQKAIQLHSEYKFDEHYFVEHRRDAEQGGFDLIVFSCTEEAVIGVLSEFLVTCGVTNLNCKEILG